MAKTKYMVKGKSLFVTPRKVKYKEKSTSCRKCLQMFDSRIMMLLHHEENHAKRHHIDLT